MSAMTRLAQRAREAGAQEGQAVPSPCVSVCRMDPARDLCEGCFRKLDEIAAWSAMDDARKRQVWQAIAQRVAQRQCA